ncbi:MAG: hypothetical protein K2L05_07740 [Muribaculaceae bacterium]|nr:hypothetical protein [Muribaculaceae bacterium]MDE7335822.1 hypothetical protein [Muribaculaceae bacterium]
MILTRPFRSIAAAASLMLVVVMAACTSPAGEIQEPTLPAEADPTVYRTGFYLTVGELADDGKSRTTPVGDYNAGEGIENFIDLENGNFHVLLYTVSNTFLAEITELQITPVESYDSSKRYYINGATKANISNGNFKVMVIANWPQELPKQPSMDNVFATRFDFNGTAPSKENPIPLYGITQVTLGELQPGVAYNLGNIHLIRAVAKIELIIDDNVSERLTPSKVQLTRYNKQGFCAPSVKSQSDYVQNNWGLDYLAKPYIPTPVEQGQQLDFTVVEEGKRYVLYVPEFANSHLLAAENRSRICINFKESLLEDRFIDLIDNSTSVPVIADIKRNVWYRLRLINVNENVEPICEVNVMPYKVIDLDPIFGIDK